MAKALAAVYVAAYNRVRPPIGKAVQLIITPDDLNDLAYEDESWMLANPSAAAWARLRAAELVSQIDDTTRSRLADFIERSFVDTAYTATQLRDDIGSQVEQMYEGRADTIAQTEATLAANGGTLDGYRDNGTHFVMVHDGTDYDEECANADGQIWTVDDADSNSIEHPNCGRSFDELDDADVDPSEVEDA